MVFEGLQYQCSKNIFYSKTKIGSVWSIISIVTSGASIYYYCSGLFNTYTKWLLSFLLCLRIVLTFRAKFTKCKTFFRRSLLVFSSSIFRERKIIRVLIGQLKQRKH